MPETNGAEITTSPPFLSHSQYYLEMDKPTPLQSRSIMWTDKSNKSIYGFLSKTKKSQRMILFRKMSPFMNDILKFASYYLLVCPVYFGIGNTLFFF